MADNFSPAMDQRTSSIRGTGEHNPETEKAQATPLYARGSITSTHGSALPEKNAEIKETIRKRKEVEEIKKKKSQNNAHHGIDGDTHWGHRDVTWTTPRLGTGVYTKKVWEGQDPLHTGQYMPDGHPHLKSVSRVQLPFKTMIERKMAVPLKKGRFNAWRSQSALMLKNYGLWHAIELSEYYQQLPTLEQNAMNASAHAFIYMGLYDDLVDIVSDNAICMGSAAGLWDWLLEFHNRQSYQNIAIIRRRMEELTLKDCKGDVDVYIGSIIRHLADLRALGETVSVPHLKDIIISKLPACMGYAKSKIRHSKKTTTMDQMRTIILDEMDALKKDGLWKSEESSGNANYTADHSRGRQHDGNRTLGNDNKEGNSSREWQERRRCFRCKKTGHLKRNCPNKGDEKSKEGREQQASGRQAQAHGETNKQDEKNEREELGFSLVAQANERRISEEEKEWILDTGASHHMTHLIQSLYDVEKLDPPMKVFMANNTLIYATHKGTVRLLANDPSKYVTLTVEDVLYSPEFSTSLLSWRQVKKGSSGGVCLHGDGDTLDVLHGQHSVLRFKLKNNAYSMCSHRVKLRDEHDAQQQGPGKVLMTTIEEKEIVSNDSISTWHQRLGHMNQGDIKRMAIEGGYGIPATVAKQELKKCDTCQISKHHKSPFNKSYPHRYPALMHTLVSDQMGPITPTGRRGEKFVLNYIEGHSRRNFVFCNKNKNDQVNVYRKLSKHLKNVTGKFPSFFLSDNCNTYHNKEMFEMLEQQGTRVRASSTYTPEQNSVAERAFCTLQEMMRALMSQSGLPRSFWPDAARTASFIMNRVPHHGLGGRTPNEVFYGGKDDISYLRPFGCKAYIHIPKELRKGKLSNTAKVGIYLGPDEARAASKVYIPKEKTVYSSRHVTFDESCYPFLKYDISEEKKKEHEDPKEYEELFEDMQEITQDGLQEGGERTVLGHEQSHKNVSDVEENIERRDKEESMNSSERDEERTKSITDFLGDWAKSETPEASQMQEENSEIPKMDYPNVEEGEENSTELMPDTILPDEVLLQEMIDAQQEGRRPRRKNTDYSKDYASIRCARASLAEAIKCVGSRRAAIAFVKTARFAHQIASEKQLNDLPRSVKEALQGTEKEQWREAIKAELTSHRDRKTWRIVNDEELPEDANLLPTKMVFKKKVNKQGQISRYKCRLVIRGDKQKEGVDYFETYSPTTRIQTLRTFLMTALTKGLDVKQVDVPTAYLFGDLEERLFITLPNYWNDIMQDVEPYPEGATAELLQAVYGTKQAGRGWNRKADDFFKALGYLPCPADPCLYHKETGGKKSILLLYVDDILFAGNDETVEQELTNALKKEFGCPPLELVDFMLGIQITKKSDEIYISQSNYIKRLIEKYGMEDCKTITTPVQTGHVPAPRAPEDRKEINFPYREAVGSLMYAAVCTRPDIAYPVSVATRYLNDPSTAHVRYVKRVIRYLAATIEYCLLYKAIKNKEVIMHMRGDSSYADDKINRRSTYGFNILLQGNLLSWKSKLTTPVALSTMEAELFAACEAAKEGLWIKKLYEFMTGEKVTRMILQVDNKATKDFIVNGKISSRSKHIEVRYHYLQDLVKRGEIQIEWIRGDNNDADLHTKGLPEGTHQKYVEKLMCTEI